MLEFVRNFLIENNLQNEKILVGFSGGADSTALLHILSKLTDNLTAIHLNHNWRGIEAKSDEEFAFQFAKSLGVEFYSEALDENNKKTETIARELRYDFFKRAKEKFNAKAVFLAHNKNDNAETLIYRLIKGTGTKGMSGIPIIRDFYYRPLLNFSRAEIENYLNLNNLKFILDSSNKNTKYKRNLIREEIFPLMNQINKKSLDSISTFIKINEMNQKILDKIISEAQMSVTYDGTLLRDKFLNLSLEIQYEIINRKFIGILKNRDFKNTEKILNFIKNNISSTLSLNSELLLKVYDNKIYTVKKPSPIQNAETSLKLGENYFEGFKITIEPIDTPSIFSKNEYINLDFKNDYKIRFKKAGDIFQPFGQKSAQKLKTFLIKKKIPSEIRDKIPMITLGDEILLISNIAMSEKLRVDKFQKTCYKFIITKEQ